MIADAHGNDWMMQLFVGSYTETLNHAPSACGKGIYSYLFDRTTGQLTLLNSFSGIRNPSYLAFHRQNLYAVSEVPEGPGIVAMLSVNAKGIQQIVSEAPIPDRGGCHLSCSENRVFVAAYIDGSISAYRVNDLNIECEGGFSYHGSGPNIQRQTSAHAHQAYVSPDKRWLYVCDLGSDAIWRHRLDRPLSTPIGRTAVKPGFGPRHICFHPYLNIAYLICELSGMVVVLEYDDSDGTLAPLYMIDSLRPGFTGHRSSAAIKIHPSAKTLYVSNRADNSFTVFAIDGSGKLEPIDYLSTLGATPRDIAFDPSGEWLITANQDSNSLAVFKVNPDTGEPGRKAGIKLSCSTPVCLVFQEIG